MRNLLLTLLTLTTILPPGAQAGTPPLTYDRISFNENAGTDVENDTLVAVLFVQKEGPRAPELANRVNRTINRALERLKPMRQIKVQSQSYRTNATYEDGRVSGWRVHQSIRRESRDSEVLGEVIGDLQESLKVQSINYRVSEEARRQHTNRLTETALQRFQQRAFAIARAMGRSGYRVVKLRLNQGHAAPAPRDMLMAKSTAPVAAPRIQAGTQRIEVTVSGEIELKD